MCGFRLPTTACQVTIDLFFVFALHLKALHAIKSVDLKFSLSSSSLTVLIRCRYMSRGSYLHFILNRGWQCVCVCGTGGDKTHVKNVC